MKELTPEDRAGYAHRALRAHYEAREGAFDPDEDVETLMIDLITDLRHFADDAGIDFHKVLDMTYQHYLSEKG